MMTTLSAWVSFWTWLVLIIQALLHRNKPSDVQDTSKPTSHVLPPVIQQDAADGPRNIAHDTWALTKPNKWLYDADMKDNPCTMKKSCTKSTNKENIILKNNSAAVAFEADEILGRSACWLHIWVATQCRGWQAVQNPQQKLRVHLQKCDYLFGYLIWHSPTVSTRQKRISFQEGILLMVFEENMNSPSIHTSSTWLLLWKGLVGGDADPCW